MAYMSQERKAQLAPQIKKVLSKYKMKGSIGVDNHSTLVVNLKSGPLDIIGNYNAAITDRDPTGNKHINLAKGHIQVNNYWLNDHYTGKVQAFLKELNAAMNVGNHDRSDLQTDYFDVGWYVNINVGKWNKEYEFTGKAVTAAPARTLKPSQRIRVILNRISFRTTIGDLDNCMDHTNQREVVDMALAVIRNEPEINGFAGRFNDFEVQVDLL